MFCGSDASGKKRAKEHIIPLHLQERFSLLKQRLDHSPFKSVKDNFSGGHVTDAPPDRSLSFSSFLAGRVCKTCNGGWMSKLETQVQPYLYDLIRGQRGLASLETDEKLRLSCWALKTSVALSQSVGAWQHMAPEKHARELRKSSGQYLPDNVVVFALIANSDDFLWSLCPTWPVETNLNVQSAEFRYEYENAYKIFIQFGRLMLLSCHWPNDQVVYSRESWGPTFVGGSHLCETNTMDSRSIIELESDRVMMSIGAILTD
jgi:hypothetical protein